jgi:hypothetical protein
MIILCSKVTLSAKEILKIKVPNSGKVTQAEFDALGKKTDSMKDTDGNIIFIVPNKLSSPTIYF